MAEPSFIQLDTKPTAQLSYHFKKSSSPVLLVYLNGLGLPQAGWMQTNQKLVELRGAANLPNILTYDRFGQGLTTDRDPGDAGAEDPMHGHDCAVVVQDLRQLVTQIARDHMDQPQVDAVPIVFVANSIGCALARLYAQTYPGTVSGLLLLDSVLANTDFVSIYPDPDADGFDSASLPDGVSADLLRGARKAVKAIFHPDNGSKEGLSRKNLVQLLPASDGPALKGPDGQGPYVTVVGHDFDTFAEESAKMRFPVVLTQVYTNPFWEEYNRGLVRITETERAKGPIQAPNAGHFIQKDNPEFVAKELDELLSKVM